MSGRRRVVPRSGTALFMDIPGKISMHILGKGHGKSQKIQLSVWSLLTLKKKKLKILSNFQHNGEGCFWEGQVPVGRLFL